MTDDPFWADLQRLRQVDCKRYFAFLRSLDARERTNARNDPFWDDWQKNRRLKRVAGTAYAQKTARPELQRPRGFLKTFFAPVREHAPLLAHQISRSVRTPEFWLGVIFGMVTRLAVKAFIVSLFPATPKMATAAGFAACAGAGLAAGMVTHLVRTWYRNLKAPDAYTRQPLGGKALWDSALIGLFGGLLGGYAVNAGTVIAQSGGLAFGAATGVATGVIYAGTDIVRTVRRHEGKIQWSKLLYKSAFFGTLGGVLGVIASDLLGAHPSVAAPAGEAGTVLYVPPAAGHPVTDCCGHTPCAPVVQPPPASAASIHTAPLEAHDIKPPVKPAVPHAEHHTIKHHVNRPTHHTRPRAHTAHHARSPVKVRAHHKIRLTPESENIVLDRPKLLDQVYQPPQTIAASDHGLRPPVLKTVTNGQCATGSCAPPCETSSQLDIKGPCADPGTQCVERISFDETGKATKAVLEPVQKHVSRPYFEAEIPRDSQVASRHITGKSVRLAPASQNVTKLSLVVPLEHNKLALGTLQPLPA